MSENFLNARYIEEHKISIHDYESWGKAVVEQILTQVTSRSGEDVRAVETEIPVKVEANTKGCITVTVGFASVHVKV